MLYCGDLSIKSKRTPGRVSECVRQKEKETVLLLLISASDPYWVLLNKKSRKEAAKSCWNWREGINLNQAWSPSHFSSFFFTSPCRIIDLWNFFIHTTFIPPLGLSIHPPTPSSIHLQLYSIIHSPAHSFIHSLINSSIIIIIIIINVIFYSAFISTSQSASHRRKDKGVPLKDQNQRNGESILSFTWCINS